MNCLYNRKVPGVLNVLLLASMVIWRTWKCRVNSISKMLHKSMTQMIKNRPRCSSLCKREMARAVVLGYIHEQYVQKYGGALALLRLYIPELKKAAEWVKIAASSGTAAALEYQQDAARSPSISLSLHPPATQLIVEPSVRRKKKKKQKLTGSHGTEIERGQSWTKTLLKGIVHPKMKIVIYQL